MTAAFVACVVVIIAAGLALVAIGHAVGRHAKARECMREKMRQEVWDLIESAIRRGDDPAVNSFTMIHAIDNLILARIKLAKLNGDA